MGVWSAFSYHARRVAWHVGGERGSMGCDGGWMGWMGGQMDDDDERERDKGSQTIPTQPLLLCTYLACTIVLVLVESFNSPKRHDITNVMPAYLTRDLAFSSFNSPTCFAFDEHLLHAHTYTHTYTQYTRPDRHTHTHTHAVQPSTIIIPHRHTSAAIIIFHPY